jgi:hypothetical protein
MEPASSPTPKRNSSLCEHKESQGNVKYHEQGGVVCPSMVTTNPTLRAVLQYPRTLVAQQNAVFGMELCQDALIVFAEGCGKKVHFEWRVPFLHQHR